MGSWEASFIAALQMRVSQKGMQGDKMFLLREMNMWLKRFKNASKTKFGSLEKVQKRWDDWEEGLAASERM